MDTHNRSWIPVIELVLEKVKTGIPKGIWSYKYELEIDDLTDWYFYSGEAESGAYHVNFRFDEAPPDVCSYEFTIKFDGVETLSLTGDVSLTDAPGAIMRKYWTVLKDTYEQAQAISALEIVDELPE